jgi:hypothetical protein
MLTRDDFDTWFADYASRWPSVRDYANRQPLVEPLLDTWHQSLAAFDTSVLEAITAGMLSGDWEPVEPMKFGTWSNEIRRLGREVLHRRREKAEKRQVNQQAKVKPFSPLRAGSMTDIYHACCAVYELLPGADQDVVDAAIALADDHTPYERDKSLAFLAGAGITWEQIQTVAGRLKRAGGRPVLQGVPAE